MKPYLKTAAVLLTLCFGMFSSCSSDSNDSGDKNPPAQAPATDISSQAYNLLDCLSPSDCDFNVPYTGSGVIKNAILDDEDEPIEMITVGAIANGKVNLEFNTPDEKLVNEEGNYAFFELYVYDSKDEVIGKLYLMDSGFNRKDDVVAFYVYYSKDYINKDTTAVPSQNVTFVNDMDAKKGWNLYYYANRYDDEQQTVTKSTDAAVLQGKELRWYLFNPNVH